MKEFAQANANRFFVCLCIRYLFFGGTVSPKIEICPDPATFNLPESSGLGK